MPTEEFKKMPYRFLDHTADVMFIAEGKTINELFEQSGLALSEIIVDLSNVEEKKTIVVDIEADSAEALLFSFLQEIIYYKDAEQLVFKSYEVSIKSNLDERKYALHAKMHGEVLDAEKHAFGTDPKSVTYHNYYVKETSEGWKARVIVDI